jgi:hypothetical protein
VEMFSCWHLNLRFRRHKPLPASEDQDHEPVRSHMKPRTFSKLMVAAAAAATVLTALNVALNDRIPSDDRNCEVHGICEIRFRNVHTESPFEVTTLKLNRTRSTHCAYIMPRTVRFADV